MIPQFECLQACKRFAHGSYTLQGCKSAVDAEMAGVASLLEFLVSLWEGRVLDHISVTGSLTPPVVLRPVQLG